MRRNLTTVAIAAMLVMVAGATAKATIGTSSGTVIINFATVTALGGISVQTTNVSTTVKPIYGLAVFDESLAPDKTATAGGFATYTVSVTNNGNTSNKIGLSVGAVQFNGSPGTTTDWKIEADDSSVYTTPMIWAGGFSTASFAAGDSTETAVFINPGSAATFTLKVTVAGDAADAATMAFTLTLQTASTPVGQYTSLDAVTIYGGPASFARTVGADGATVTTTVNGAVLTLAKTVTGITAPGGYTGGGTDPVPGARITYQIAYQNTGGGAASTVVIRDYVPANTTYDPGTIVTTGVDIWPGAGAKTDAGDTGVTDDCDFGNTVAGALTCTAASVPSSNSGTIIYSVIID